jgi:hypothetical protein
MKIQRAGKDCAGPVQYDTVFWNGRKKEAASNFFHENNQCILF